MHQPDVEEPEDGATDLVELLDDRQPRPLVERADDEEAGDDEAEEEDDEDDAARGPPA